MEPRPSRPSRATGQSSTRTTRTPWTPSPTVEPTTSQRTADIYSAPQAQGSGSGGQWYGQQGAYAPEQNDYRQTGPMTPIKPRNERSNKLLRYLLASLLLIGVIGGGAYAITRYLDNNDSKDNPPVAAVTDGSVTPTLAATQASGNQQSAPTPTTAAQSQPTATTAAASATEAPTDTNVDSASTGDSGTPGSGQTTTTDPSGSSQAFLPDESALEGNWAVTDEGQRTKAQVAEAIGANGDELLTTWRWRENYYRDLTRIDPDSFPDETTYINVSVHRFANADGAAAALKALSDIVVEAQGLTDVETPAIGDDARGLSGPGDGVNLYVLYVQDGKFLLRIGGSSATGDPSATVNALAQTIVDSQAAES